jgi:O-antigen/teichoic acid export membrane protein
MHGLGHIPSTVLLARRRPDILAKLYLCYIFLYVPLLYFLLETFGLIGAALAWALRGSCDISLFFFARTGRTQLRQAALCSILVLASSVSAYCLDWREAAYWIVLTLLCIVGAAVAFSMFPAGAVAGWRPAFRKSIGQSGRGND